MLKKLITSLLLFTSSSLLAVIEAPLPISRQDGCVILNTQKVENYSGSLTREFHLLEPGKYVVQIVHKPEDAGTELSASVKVNGKELDDKLSRDYWIEDGIVSTFVKPITFIMSGQQSVTVHCDKKPEFIRLIPAIFLDIRIKVGSQKYYKEWIKTGNK